MFCPKCSAKNDLDQKFCRACGLNLEQTAVSVREQSGEEGPAELSRQEKALQKFGTVAFTGFGIVIGISVLGIIYAIVANMILNGSQPLYGIILIAFIVFAALTLGYVFWNESLEEKRTKLRSTSPIKEVETATTADLLEESSFEPISSVIEHTTSRLEMDTVKRRKHER